MKRGCTQCGECLNVCPVYQQFKKEEYSPKGKRLLLEPLDKDFAAPGATDLLPWDDVKELARLCAGCGKCQAACARKLSTVDLLADVRAANPHWTQQFWQIWIKNMGPMWPSLGLMASLVPGWLAPGQLKPLLDTAKALVDKGDIQPWGIISKDPAATIDTAPILPFTGCTANNVRKKWGQKTDALLKAWGYSLLDPSGFACCGGTMHHAGRFEIQKTMENQNITYWRSQGKPRIAVFCASCYHSLVGYADPGLMGDEVAEWKKCLMPLSTLLVGAKINKTPNTPTTYGYHQPCHWPADKDMAFLQNLFPGLVKGTGLCCGMGGILQMSNATLSRTMADSCLQGFPDSVKHILTGCSGCVMQLSAASNDGVTISHWLDAVRL